MPREIIIQGRLYFPGITSAHPHYKDYVLQAEVFHAVAERQRAERNAPARPMPKLIRNRAKLPYRPGRKFASSSQPGKEYTVMVSRTTGMAVSCNCPGWIYHRKCWHVAEVNNKKERVK
jgi:hypothetical protein